MRRHHFTFLFLYIKHDFPPPSQMFDIYLFNYELIFFVVEMQIREKLSERKCLNNFVPFHRSKFIIVAKPPQTLQIHLQEK